MCRIIHILNADKFFPDYINFLFNNIPSSNTCHKFFITGDHIKYGFPDRKNLVFIEPTPIGRLRFYMKVILAAIRCEKIIFHGLFNQTVIKLFSIIPLSSSKLFWVILGGDLYQYKNRVKFTWWRHEVFRYILMKRIGNHITYIKGDHDLANLVYASGAKLFHCIMYPSNVVTGHITQQRRKNKNQIVILLGNSATKTNHHQSILKMLLGLNRDKIKVICPLSYGDPNYADEIERYAKQKLGPQFYSLRSFVSRQEYANILGSVDIAIMGHDRQQAMGNILTLVALGKKIYMNSDITSYEYLKNLGIEVYDIKHLKFDLISPIVAENNNKKILSEHSMKNLIRQWENIFDHR